MTQTISKRLRAAADFVRAGAFVADVGTDHAYLPLFLLSVGKIAVSIAKLDKKLYHVGGILLGTHDFLERNKCRTMYGGKLRKYHFAKEIEYFHIFGNAVFEVLL